MPRMAGCFLSLGETMANIKLNESAKEVEKLFMAEFAKVVNAQVKRIIPRIKKRVSSLLVEFISDSQTFDELTGNLLRADFGWSEQQAGQIQSDILDIAKNDIDVRIVRQSPTGNTLPILQISLLEKGQEKYKQISEYTSKNGFEINALSWMLFQGDKIIIQDHSPHRVKGSAGRSGLSILMTPGGVFKVDSSVSGTSNRNFLSKSITERRTEIGKQIKTIVIEELNR